jgi:hypothetical protein
MFGIGGGELVFIMFIVNVLVLIKPEMASYHKGIPKKH